MMTTIDDFVFEGIDGITRWNICPADIFHDLPEGVLSDAFELILNTFCVIKDGDKFRYQLISGKTNQSVIEEKFEAWRFKEGKPTLVWKSDTGFSLTGKGFQVSFQHQFVL